MKINFPTTLLLSLILISCGKDITGDELSKSGFYSTPAGIISQFSNKQSQDYRINYLLGKAFFEKKDYKKSIFYFANSCFKSKQNFKLRLFPQPVYSFVDGFHFKSPYYDDSIFHISKLFYTYREYKYVIKFIELMDSCDTALYRDAVILKSMCLEKLNRDNEAVELLRKTLEKFTDSGSSALINIRIASILEKNNNYKRAAASYLNILTKGSDRWHNSLAADHILYMVREKKAKFREKDLILTAKALADSKKYKNASEIIESKLSASTGREIESLKISVYTNTAPSKAESLLKQMKEKTYFQSLMLDYANALWDRGSKGRAVTLYREIIDRGKADKDIARRILTRLSYYYDDRNNPLLVNYMTKYAELFPGDSQTPKFYWLMGRYNLRKTSIENALKYFNIVIDKYPESTYSANSSYWKLRILRASKNPAEKEQIKLLSGMHYYNPSSPYTLREIEALSANMTGRSILDKYKSEKKKENYMGMLLYTSMLFIKNGYSDAVKTMKNDFPDNFSSKFTKFQEIINKGKYRSSMEKKLMALEKYFAVGDEDAIKNEISMIDNGEEDREYDIALTYALFGKKYHNFFFSSSYSFKIINREKATEYLPFMDKATARMLYPAAFIECINSAARAYGLKRSTILSMIKAESYFIPGAVSPVGARGLLQLMPPTASGIAKSLKIRKYDLLDPCTSIKFGADYIKWLEKYYKGRIEYMVAAYNAGAGNVNNWIKKYSGKDMDYFTEFTPFNETRYYIYNTQKFKIQYESIDKGGLTD